MRLISASWRLPRREHVPRTPARALGGTIWRSHCHHHHHQIDRAVWPARSPARPATLACSTCIQPTSAHPSATLAAAVMASCACAAATASSRARGGRSAHHAPPLVKATHAKPPPRASTRARPPDRPALVVTCASAGTLAILPRLAGGPACAALLHPRCLQPCTAQTLAWMTHAGRRRATRACRDGPPAWSDAGCFRRLWLGLRAQPL